VVPRSKVLLEMYASEIRTLKLIGWPQAGRSQVHALGGVDGGGRLLRQLYVGHEALHAVEARLEHCGRLYRILEEPGDVQHLQ